MGFLCSNPLAFDAPPIGRAFRVTDTVSQRRMTRSTDDLASCIFSNSRGRRNKQSRCFPTKSIAITSRSPALCCNRVLPISTHMACQLRKLLNNNAINSIALCPISDRIENSTVNACRLLHSTNRLSRKLQPDDAVVRIELPMLKRDRTHSHFSILNHQRLCLFCGSTKRWQEIAPDQCGSESVAEIRRVGAKEERHDTPPKLEVRVRSSS